MNTQKKLDREYKQNFENLEERMKQISLLLVHQVVSSFPEKMNKTEKMIFLSRVGFNNNEIALLVGSTSGAVSARLSEYHKNRNKKK
jgi:hypothetical protein